LTFRAKVAEAGIDLATAVSVRSPAQQIIKMAESMPVDHIGIGQRGKNSHERAGTRSCRRGSCRVGWGRGAVSAN